MSFKKIVMFSYFLQFLAFSSAGHPSHSNCKAVPGSNDWPGDDKWARFNRSLSENLLKVSPPGAVCHPTQTTFDPVACPAVAAGWLTSAWQSDNPVGTVKDNFNNDTCLPIPTFPCSGEGYPIYVVNASTAEHVKKGVNFARRNNVRLIVKGTGHDYLGRSSAPNSLSIWTHHMRGVKVYDNFKPKGCKKATYDNAITAAAGTQMRELDEQAYLRNLTIVSGGANTVGVGGYLTGGGHGALSSTYGLGADQVVEIEMVTPGGNIITANECQNEDLFWAMRGGGGSTFGVITSITIKAHPSAPFFVSSVFLGTLPTSGEVYWDAMASLLSKYPSLDAQGISCYSFLAANFTSAEFNITAPINGFLGSFNLAALHPENTTASFEAVLKDTIAEVTAPYPPLTFFSTVTTKAYPDFWTWWKDNNGPLDAGGDGLIGSRLLDGKALTADMTALKESLKGATASGVTSMYLVSGHGVHNAVVPGGSNAVNPAWRTSYVHAVLGVGWNPFDTAEKAKQENLLTNTYVEALRKLAPDTGAYINEADPNEPNFQQTFWGSNYPRLLKIKNKYDPTDVFWCQPCVGNEGWEVVDDVLCRK